MPIKICAKKIKIRVWANARTHHSYAIMTRRCLLDDARDARDRLHASLRRRFWELSGTLHLHLSTHTSDRPLLLVPPDLAVLLPRPFCPAYLTPPDLEIFPPGPFSHIFDPPSPDDLPFGSFLLGS